jgi:hypothetical protein
MNCVKGPKRCLAGTASGGSIIGLILLPKCPFCFAMWLGTTGITSLSGQVQSALAGLLVTIAAIVGWNFRRTNRTSEKT